MLNAKIKCIIGRLWYNYDDRCKQWIQFAYDIVHLHEDHFYCVYTTTCLHLANLLNWCTFTTSKLLAFVMDPGICCSGDELPCSITQRIQILPLRWQWGGGKIDIIKLISVMIETHKCVQKPSIFSTFFSQLPRMTGVWSSASKVSKVLQSSNIWITKVLIVHFSSWLSNEVAEMEILFVISSSSAVSNTVWQLYWKYFSPCGM